MYEETAQLNKNQRKEKRVSSSVPHLHDQKINLSVVQVFAVKLLFFTYNTSRRLISSACCSVIQFAECDYFSTDC